MAASVYARALQKAADLVGGRDKLARLLHVPRAEIDKWIAEQGKPPPRDVFLHVVDLILDEGGPAAGSDAPEPPPSREAAGSSERYTDWE